MWCVVKNIVYLIRHIVYFNIYDVCLQYKNAKKFKCEKVKNTRDFFISTSSFEDFCLDRSVINVVTRISLMRVVTYRLFTRCFSKKLYPNITEAFLDWIVNVNEGPKIVYTIKLWVWLWPAFNVKDILRFKFVNGKFENLTRQKIFR